MGGGWRGDEYKNKSLRDFGLLGGVCIFPWCGRLEIALLFMGFSAAAQKLGFVGSVPLCGQGSSCACGRGQGLAACSGSVSVCLPASPRPAWCHPDEQHSSVKCAYQGQVLVMTCLWQRMPVVTDWVSAVPAKSHWPMCKGSH